VLDQVPASLGTIVDVLIGAAMAYRDLIRANRVLSGAGGYLHGVSLAVLLQAIAFVSLILYAQGSEEQIDISFGALHLARLTVQPPILREALSAVVFKRWPADEWFTATVVLGLLVITLAAVLATPRLLRSLR
jgi:hypothetical protein